jgi:copper(I)-binding protein|tara:strand:+ start:412 stop:849 length:438 start_codon:yes stop_codon:yes gene_type:complete
MNNKFFKVFFVIIFSFIVISCAETSPVKVIIKDAHLYVPLKGSMMTSGYLSIVNKSNENIEILSIDCSPIRAEIHETTINAKGLMKMTKPNSVVLESQSSTIFVPGGKHIMFWGLNEFDSKYLPCSFSFVDGDSINFNFLVQTRG